jgi:hypothetical protein
MALDHFVPQVHLRRFLSPALGHRLHAIRKTDGFRFAARTQDVCRIDEGSTNAYLAEPRAIEEFLKSVEPHYNQAVKALGDGSVDDVNVGVLARFVAYVASCSPTAMRLFSEPLRVAVEATTTIMDAAGALPRAPESLEGASVTDLISDGTTRIDIDRKFPQALGIGQILDLVRMLEACDWEILHSPSSAKPFLTSDFPTAIEVFGPARPMNRVVPLSPDLAVRLVPGQTALGRVSGTSERGGRRHRTASGHEVVEVNRTIVRCAEAIVFFRDDAPWVATLVEANRAYRVAADARRIPAGRGYLLATSMNVAKVS